MHPGDIVAGKYRVANILSRTRGLLLEARHTEFDQRVVIRLLSPALGDAKEIERFRREARTLSKVESEHVARIIDVGTHSDGSFFLVRQYLDGVDLGTHLRTHGALRLDEAVLYLLQASEAVQDTHSNNIILRELQPSHLFLSKRRGGSPLIKLIDFGTAKLLKDPAAAMPVNGEMTATVMFGMSRYSSPELVRKTKGVDHRTDVWSLGCILYELLAAVPPFQGELAELMLRITREEPVPLSRLRPDIPRELDQIIGWALAKDPASRFANVYAFAHALKPYSNAEGQVLIDRIGRLAHANVNAAAAPAQISPTSPLAKRPASSYPTAAPAASATPDFEKTAFLPETGSIPPPPQQPAQAQPVAPPARTSQPGRYGGTGVEPDAQAASTPSVTTGAYPAQNPEGQEKRKRQRKTAMIAFAGSLVLLPVLVVVLMLALRGDTETEGPVAVSPAPPTSSAVMDDPPDDDSAPEDDEAVAAASGSASAAPIDIDALPDPPPSTTTRPTPPPTRTGGQLPRPAPTPRTTSRPPPPPPPPPKKGGKGTLVAIAIGGSCTFSVDGSPKGTKSSIRMQVPVGPHTVSCRAPGGATRTQRVNVRTTKPGIASFRVN